jgi:SAM-dependent methyltransferase
MLTRIIARQLAHPSGWIGRWITAPWLNRANGVMNRLTLDGLDVRAGSRVLEVGFGGGDLLAWILSAGAIVAGVDRSADMVGLAQRRFRRELAEGRLELHTGDVGALPFPAGAFDRLCTVNTIYFWSDPAAALAECRRVMAPGGRMVVGFDDRRALEAWPGHVHGFRLYEVAEVEDLMRDAGFTVLESATAGAAGQGRVHRVCGRVPNRTAFERNPGAAPVRSAS